MFYELFFGSFSDDEDEVNSELAFFSEACSAAIEVSKPKRTRNQVERDRYGVHDRLVEAYFSEHQQYDEATFRTRFRMSRRLFTRLVQEISDHYPYFQVRPDCSGRIGISALVKCTFAIRQMGYDTVPDALDEYLQMGATTTRDNLVHFCNAVMELYGREYLQQPTHTDMEKLYAHHKQKHGFFGMIGSIDCTDWPWENCTHAFKAQFNRGDHGSDPFILLEAIASQDLWIWHAFFGVSGMNNDVNVLQQSPIFNNLKTWKAQDVPFVANDVAYKRRYYLTDGIYSKWFVLIKSIKNPGSNDHKRIMYKTAHEEASRKDVERAFGVLKMKWKIIKQPARGMKLNEQHRDDDPVKTHEETVQVIRELHDKTAHLSLKADLVERIWHRSNHTN